jgi:hypothetical protein
MKSFKMHGLACALIFALPLAHAAPPPAWTSAWVDPVTAPALLMPLAADTLVLGLIFVLALIALRQRRLENQEN